MAKNEKKLGTIAIVAGISANLILLGIAWGTITNRVSELEKDTTGVPATLARMDEKLKNIEKDVGEIRAILQPSPSPRR